MWTLIVMALASILWLVVFTAAPGADAMQDAFSIHTLHLVAMGLTALGCAQLLQRLLSYAFFTTPSGRGLASSDLIRSVMNATLYLVTGLLFLRFGLGLDVTNVLATSALLTVIMGLALQPTLGHLFSGLSIELERPLRVGDYVRRDELEGRVVSLSWRSVSLETDRGTLLIMPNAEFTSRSVEIIRASQASRHQIVFHMVSGCSPSLVHKLAMEVLRSDLVGIEPTPVPSVIILGTDPATGTLRFAARFFTRNFFDRARIGSLFIERLWFALSREGLTYPQRPVLDWASEDPSTYLGLKNGDREASASTEYSPPGDARPWTYRPTNSTSLQPLVRQHMAELSAPLQEALLAAGRMQRYGPAELCQRGLAGFLAQGTLFDDRLPDATERQRDLEALRTHVAADSTPTNEPVRMSTENFDLFVRRGALAIGPLAHSLCLRIAAYTDDLSLAHEVFADAIQNGERKKSFMEQMPPRSNIRLEAGAWFGWSSMLGLEDLEHRCSAKEECAVFVWAEADLRPLLAQATAQEVQAFTQFLQKRSSACERLSSTHLQAWAANT